MYEKPMRERLDSHLIRAKTFLESIQRGLLVLDGPMRSGKSALLSALPSHFVHLQAFYPKRDHRNEGIVSRNGTSLSAHAIDHLTQLNFSHFNKEDIFLVDEAQFFSEELLAAFLKESMYRRIILAGLDTDFRREPFAWQGSLWQHRETQPEQAFLHLRLSGICDLCEKEPSTHTLLTTHQPIVGNILIGDAPYKSVCLSCHEHYTQKNSP